MLRLAGRFLGRVPRPGRAFSTRATGTSFQYDLLVVGGGSGGVAAARRASEYGARVCLVDWTFARDGLGLGGTCVNRGCVPKKLFKYASHFHDVWHDAEGYGWTSSSSSSSPPSLDWPTLRTRKTVELQRLNTVYDRLLSTSSVDVRRGVAVFRDAHTVHVQGVDDEQQELTARYLLCATGAQPWRPAHVPGVSLADVSDDVFEWDVLPQSLAIVGGGYIGCEFASMLVRMGVEVTLVHRGPSVLRGFDQDLQAHVLRNLQHAGVRVLLDTDVVSLQRHDDASLKVDVSPGQSLHVQRVLYATGRRPNTSQLGLDVVGVDLHSHGGVRVDDAFCTSVPSIYAVGDCTGNVELTPVAIQEGRAVAENLFNTRRRAPARVAYDVIPSAVFTTPEAATVGLTEAQAREQLGHVEVYRAEFKPMYATLAGRPDDRVLVKVVVDGDSRRVVGCHAVGEQVAEMVQCLAVALTAGATKDDFDQTIALHPSTAEEFVLLRHPDAVYVNGELK